MAERIDAAAAARIAAVLDRGEVAIERDGLSVRLPARIGLVVLDEGLTQEECPPPSLMERVAFHLSLSDAADDERDDDPGPAEVAAARARLALVTPADDSVIEGLCAVSDVLGLRSPRPVLLALRAARAHAALRGGLVIGAEDAAVGARLVLAPRALAAPAEAEASTGDAQSQDLPEPPVADGKDEATNDTRSLDETALVIAAIQAALPDGLLGRVGDEIRTPGARPTPAGPAPPRRRRPGVDRRAPGPAPCDRAIG